MKLLNEKEPLVLLGRKPDAGGMNVLYRSAGDLLGRGCYKAACEVFKLIIKQLDE